MNDLWTEEQIKSAPLDELRREWHLHCFIREEHKKQVERLERTLIELDEKSQEKRDKVRMGYKTWQEAFDDYVAGGLTTDQYRDLKAKWGKYQADKTIWEDRLKWATALRLQEIAYTDLLRQEIKYRKENKKRKPRAKKRKQVKIRYYDPRRRVSKNMKPAQPKERQNETT